MPNNYTMKIVPKLFTGLAVAALDISPASKPKLTHKGTV